MKTNSLLVFGMVLILIIQYSCSTARNSQTKFPVNKTIDSELVCIDSNYINELILPEITGKMYLLDSLGSKKSVFVHWQNGYLAMGMLFEDKAFKKWYVYDRNSRLRKVLFFGHNGSFLLSYTEFDKHGKMVKHSDASVPF